MRGGGGRAVDFVCCMRSDQWGAQLAGKPRGCAPLSTEEYPQRQKIHTTPAGGLILSIHKQTCLHEFIEASMQGRDSLACGLSAHMQMRLPGSGQRLPGVPESSLSSGAGGATVEDTL